MEKLPTNRKTEKNMKNKKGYWWWQFEAFTSILSSCENIIIVRKWVQRKQKSRRIEIGRWMWIFRRWQVIGFCRIGIVAPAVSCELCLYKTLKMKMEMEQKKRIWFSFNVKFTFNIVKKMFVMYVNLIKREFY